ncbi:MAG TPA: hypothetical protein DIC35_04800 [Candidatus Moranbacteria bacterium]|nr:hypothetical protein [Candidatus Moranbacteria bacterium]
MKYRNFIKLSIAIFLIAAIAMFASPKEWRYFLYHPIYLGIVFLVSAFLIYFPQIVFRFTVQEKKEMIRKTQATLASAFLLNALGEFGFYKLYLIGFEYDKLIHLVNSMLFSFLLGKILVIWKNFSFRQTVWRTVLAIFIGGVGWELWEIFSDFVFHTLEWGVYGEHNFVDTIGDLIWNCAGILMGVVLLKLTMKEALFKKSRTAF